MREIVVRSLTSDDWLKRDCQVTETIEQADSVSTVTRRCTYHVESRVTVPSIPDTVRWAHSLDPNPPRQVYVTKELNPDTGQEQITYKILGHFYVVSACDILCIGYRHVLSMTVKTGGMVSE
jgi:hypothetical protein